MPASTHYNTTYENAPWIPEVIANESLGPLNAYLNLGKTVAKDTDLTPVREGDVINVPKRGTLTAIAKAEDTPVTLQHPAGTTVPVTIDQHWDVSFGEEDFTAALQSASPQEGYLGDAVAVLAEKIENTLLSHVDEFSSVSASSGTTGIADVALVREKLAINKVPRLQTKFAYVHPTVITDLLQANAFLDPKLIPNNTALTDGTIGRIHDIDFFEGTLVSGSGSPSVYKNLVYARNAMVLASRPLRLVGQEFGVQSANVQSEAGVSVRVVRSYNPSYKAIQISLDVLFGTGVLDNRLGFKWVTA